MKRNVLLFGPNISVSKESGTYGGGTGGYTRNMSVYLNYFQSDKFNIIPCFHSIRGQLKLDNFIWRFFYDAFNYLKSLRHNKVEIIHILAQYRSATPREFFVCWVANFRGIPFLYEIKAGAFINYYKNSSGFQRYMIRYILKSASCLLCEGLPYIDFLKSEFNLEGKYHPNYVPDEEIPENVSEKLSKKNINILFVGYCFADKGIFELVEGCTLAANQGSSINLSIIGQEHPNFKTWIDQLQTPDNLNIIRHGRRPHPEVLEAFKRNDIYCYPTKHKGEGHNNTINEALMNGLIIITTKQGFLDTIITKDKGYILDKLSPKEIAKTLRKVDLDRITAVAKSVNGRNHLIKNFRATIAHHKLESAYQQILAPSSIVENANV